MASVSPSVFWKQYIVVEVKVDGILLEQLARASVKLQAASVFALTNRGGGIADAGVRSTI